MTDAMKVALLKAMKAPTLLPGTYTVDGVVCLRVTGTIIKDDDEQYTPTVDIPLKLVLAILLERMGCTREASMDLLVNAMTDAILLNQKGEDALAERLKDIDTAMVRVQQVTQSLPKKSRTGKTRVTARVEELPVPSAEAA